MQVPANKKGKETGLTCSSRGYVQRSVDLVMAKAFAKKKGEEKLKQMKKG